jgi:hypothetical protein
LEVNGAESNKNIIVKHRQVSVVAKKQRTGEWWQVKLTKLIGENWLELWKVRNAEVHGHDHRTQAEALRRDVSRQLDGMYQQQAHYEPQVQRLLLPDVNEHLNQPTWVTRNRLSINAPIFRERSGSQRYQRLGN